MMGVENFTFTAVKKGAATVLKVSGEHMGALIGRRGETMESLSYLASLVVNRMELMAVIVALEALNRPCEVEVHSDSQYVVNAFNKHCVINDQETARHGVGAWVPEQALREIYLRAFELPIILKVLQMNLLLF